MRRFILLLSSNAGLGYFPIAPGTVGTLAGVPAFFLLAALPAPLYAVTWTALLFLSFWTAGEAGKIYGIVDDGRIVIDELVGYLVTVAFLPFSWSAALLGFIFFRIFDIAKPPPAKQLERLPRGLGIMADDWSAGVYSCLVLHGVFWILGWT
jgi:phosphatidylglycerophosphatase A